MCMLLSCSPGWRKSHQSSTSKEMWSHVIIQCQTVISPLSVTSSATFSKSISEPREKKQKKLRVISFSRVNSLTLLFPPLMELGAHCWAPHLVSMVSPIKGETLVALSCMFVHWSRDEKGLGVPGQQQQHWCWAVTRYSNGITPAKKQEFVFLDLMHFFVIFFV